MKNRDSASSKQNGSSEESRQLSEAGQYAYAALCAVFLNKLFEDDYHKDYKYQVLSELLDHLNQPKQVCSSMYYILDGNSIEADIGPLKSVLQDECDDGLAIVKDFMLVSIAKGCYDARSRVLVKHLCLELRISLEVLGELETSLTEAMESQEHQLSEDEKREIQKKQRNTKLKRYALIGLATIGGGTLIGLTGGLAAPLVAAGAGAVIGGAGAAALGSVAGLAIIGSLFGVAGAGLTGYKMKKRVGAVEEFEFEPLVIGGPLQSATRRKQLHIAICVTGWLTSKMQDFKYPWTSLAESEEQYSLKWESKYLLQLGKAIDYILSFAVSYATQEALKYTILSGLLAAIAWPATLVTAAGVIDNPWSVCTHRAATVGKQLAEVLLSRQQGKRPVTLIGYSMGARVIFHCLEELCKRKGCEGIIEDAILLGAPVSGHPKYWQKFSRVVSGRIVNGYARGDWLLKFLYRTASIQMSIAGLRPVTWDNRRMHNVDLSDVVSGHMDYMNKIDLILEVVGVRKTSAASSLSPSSSSSTLSANNALLVHGIKITKSLSTSDKLNLLSNSDECLHDNNQTSNSSDVVSEGTPVTSVDSAHSHLQSLTLSDSSTYSPKKNSSNAVCKHGNTSSSDLRGYNDENSDVHEIVSSASNFSPKVYHSGHNEKVNQENDNHNVTSTHNVPYQTTNEAEGTCNCIRLKESSVDMSSDASVKRLDNIKKLKTYNISVGESPKNVCNKLSLANRRYSL